MHGKLVCKTTQSSTFFIIFSRKGGIQNTKRINSSQGFDHASQEQNIELHDISSLLSRFASPICMGVSATIILFRVLIEPLSEFTATQTERTSSCTIFFLPLLNLWRWPIESHGTLSLLLRSIFLFVCSRVSCRCDAKEREGRVLIDNWLVGTSSPPFSAC